MLVRGFSWLVMVAIGSYWCERIRSVREANLIWLLGFVQAYSVRPLRDSTS